MESQKFLLAALGQGACSTGMWACGDLEAQEPPLFSQYFN